jgi:hypothetical protein
LYAHYDSLSRDAVARGDLTRAMALAQIVFMYRGGITPATVSVQDSGVTTPYRAAVLWFDHSDPPPRPWLVGPPNMWNVVFWQEPDAERFIHVSGSGDSVSFAPSFDDHGLFFFGQVDWGAPGREKRGDGGYARVAVLDSSGSCAFDQFSGRCTRATFRVSLEAVVRGTLGLGGLVDDAEPPHPLSATSLALPGLMLMAPGQRIGSLARTID